LLGSSGGPVVDAGGQLLGINTKGTDELTIQVMLGENGQPEQEA
jgi:S1-C subfamily serine protease